MKIATFKIKQEDYEYYNYLIQEGDYGVHLFNLWANNTLFEAEAYFGDGYKASLEVYTTEEDVLCSTLLYSPKGDVIASLESDEGILDEYVLVGDDSTPDLYQVSIEIISGTHADLTPLKQTVGNWGSDRCERERTAQAAWQMIRALETRLREEGIQLDELDVSSPENLHTSIDQIDPTGEIRCEDFMDHSWEYAGQYGELGDNEFVNAQWRCLEVATQMLREEF